jgi:uncharacterized RDD family membrane protein YckC
MSTTQETLPRTTLASRSDRLFGQLLDGVVGGAPMLVGGAASRLSGALGTILLIAGALWAVFYYLFADGFEDGQSFGKRWIGMRVVDVETGAPCTFGKSFIRNLLLAMLGPIDWIFIFGERHQRLGDKAAGTIVIYD